MSSCPSRLLVRANRPMRSAAEWRPVPLPVALGRPQPTEYVRRESPSRPCTGIGPKPRPGAALLVAVTGPPGIGKSRLISEVARHLHAEGATVLFGRSFEENLRPYQAMAEAIGHLVEHSGLDQLIGEVPEYGPLAVRLPARTGATVPQPSSGPEGRPRDRTLPPVRVRRRPVQDGRPTSSGAAGAR